MSEHPLEGLRVLVLGSPSATVEATMARLEADGGRVHRSEEPSTGELVARVVEEAADALDGLGACIRFAPPIPPAAFLDLDDAAFAAGLDLQLGGAQRVARAVARTMARSGGGGVLTFVGSLDAWHAYPDRSIAATAMAGMVGLVRALAVDLARDGIRANAVFAGPREPDERVDPALRDRTLLRSPAHRFVTAGEVASAIAFVTGRSTGFMTGQTLRVDAGWASLNQAPDGMKFA